MKEDKDKKERGEVSRRDFLVGAGAVVVGGAIGAGIAYPLASGGDGGEVVTTTKVNTVTVPTTVTTTKTVGEGDVVTETVTAPGGTITVTQPGSGDVEPEPVETFVEGVSWVGGGGGYPAAVDVKGGKILRIRPLHLDSKYQPEDFNAWKIEARGSVFEEPMKTLVNPLQLAYKKRVYSPNRIKYPLQRVDWDPNGERNPQNRGKSKFKRISWDEASELVAGEINRIHAEYGPYSVLSGGIEGHGESKTVQSSHGCPKLLLSLMGGFTESMTNGDSWEGYYWGAEHVWGMSARAGEYWPPTNLVNDVSQNTELLIAAGYAGGETTAYMSWGMQNGNLEFWWSKIGIKSVYICPDLNYGAAVHASKWIPVMPNTDAAWMLALAYVWITEETYDQEYLNSHAIGFDADHMPEGSDPQDNFKDYVLGTYDGIPKTPEWASNLCSIPEWTIKALAREWASKVTSTTHWCGGGMIRGPYSHEPGRLEVYLLAMQGLAKPGRHMAGHLDSAYPPATVSPSVRPSIRGSVAFPKQILAKVKFPEAILEASHENPISWYGSTFPFIPTADQFDRHTYPIPEEEGGSEIHMVWSDGPCWTACNNCGNSQIEAFRSPKLECIVVQHPWLENDCLYADIILPTSTKLEEDDLGANDPAPEVFYLEKKCVEPIAEAKSDYGAVAEVAKKLGMYEQYTGGKTVEEWIRNGYEISTVKDSISWDDLNEKGFYVVPTNPNWRDIPAGYYNFFMDPENNPLQTPTGKIELYSQKLAESWPDDNERGPIARWLIGGPASEGWTHDESLLGERAQSYPLVMLSDHPRWRVHAEHDDISWLREIYTCKIKGFDGYMYEPIWINPVDAAARGIENGDIVKIFNERGATLGGAIVWERIIPGAVLQSHGARLDEIIPGQLDRGGSNNVICPVNGVSKNCAGIATTGFLVDIEKVTWNQMEEWKKQYPDAFAREYDPASGLRFNAWVEGGMD